MAGSGGRSGDRSGAVLRRAPRAREPSVSLPALAPPSNGPLTFNPPPAVKSWLDMVSATQAAQPNWMTPLVTVTPRLEQELRADFYDQQNGTGSQGNGQRIVNYGGPGGFRVEFIPAYNVEVIVAVPPYADRQRPKGGCARLGRLAAFSCQIPLPFRQQGQRRLHRLRLLSDDRRVRNEWDNFEPCFNRAADTRRRQRLGGF